MPAVLDGMLSTDTGVLYRSMSGGYCQRTAESGNAGGYYPVCTTYSGGKISDGTDGYFDYSKIIRMGRRALYSVLRRHSRYDGHGDDFCGRGASGYAGADRGAGQCSGILICIFCYYGRDKIYQPVFAAKSVSRTSGRRPLQRTEAGKLRRFFQRTVQSILPDEHDTQRVVPGAGGAYSG